MKENTIKLDGNNNIVIQDATNGNITINTKSHLPKYLTNEIPLLAEDKIVGRTNDLIELHQLLFDNKQVVVVNGLGGIGKTTLVQVYIDKYKDDYQHVAWISQKGDNIFLDFASATDLVQNLEIGKEHTDPKSIFNEIVRKLSGVETIPNLLVIDNADDSVEQIRHSLPKQPHWHILITSRNILNGFTAKPLDFLNPEDALLFFKAHYTRNELSDLQIAKLIKAIEYHTLTIEILAKTAENIEYSFEELYNAIAYDLDTEISNVNHSENTIYRIGSYLSSIFTLSKLETEEIWLLKHFACLPSEYIAFDLLKEIILEDKNYKKLPLLLNKLNKKGWLLKNTETASFKMHRIISEVVKKQKSIEMGEIVFLIDAVTFKVELDQTKDNPVDKFQWIPYGVSLLEIIEIQKQSSTEFENKTSVLQNNLAISLQNLGDYAGAKKLLEKAVMIDEKNFGVEHPITANRYSNLALVLQDLGDYAGAKKLLEKAMKSDEKNFGTEHPKTAIRFSNLATVLKNLGDYAGAKKLLEKAIKIVEKNFGVEHPSTATSYSNLATVLKDLGDYVGAKKLLEKAMKSYEKNFGVEHPTTAVSYSNLALVLQDLGDYAGAKKLLEKAMKSDEKNFGTEHPKTAIRFSNLATVLKNLGDYAGAKKMLEKAMKSYEKNFGAEHPLMVASYSNLGVLLMDFGDYAGAKKLLEKTRKINEENLGVEHPETAGNYNNLAMLYIYMKEIGKAVELWEKCYIIWSKCLGDDHPHTKSVINALNDYKK